LAKGIVLDHLPDPLYRRVERELRGTSHENIRVICDTLADRIVCRFVDAERFLAHQVLARLDCCTVNLLV